MAKINCCIPFCKSWVRGDPAAQEILCWRHWKASAGPLRRRYEAAWEEATKADRFGVEDIDACARVTAAWRDLVAHAARVSL